MEHHWTSAAIPDLTGKTAVVTGAGRDLGRLIIERLSEHGAHVFAVSREEIESNRFGPGVEPVRMNPTRMESIQRGADRIREQVDHVDILIHAASISIAPRFRSAEGHELMLATNYLGFVMLTHELSPALRDSQSPRVVLAGSGEPLRVDLNLDQLDADSDLGWSVAYAQSRLAAMLFVLELSIRARTSKSHLISAIAEAREYDPLIKAHHPVRRHLYGTLSRFSVEPQDAPALPVLFASTSDQAESGHYYAPKSRGRLRVESIPSRIPAISRSEALRTDLWQRTEDMLGVRLAIA